MSEHSTEATFEGLQLTERIAKELAQYDARGDSDCFCTTPFQLLRESNREIGRLHEAIIRLGHYIDQDGDIWDSEESYLRSQEGVYL